LNVRVRFYGMAYEEVGTRELSIELTEGSTVDDLLSIIVKKYPDLANLVYDKKGVFREYLEVAVNKTDIIGLDGLETVLKENDAVLIMPPIGGG
jgi:molybdopterin synthase sulfur carrier subunit